MKIDKAFIVSVITLLVGLGGLVASSEFQKPLNDLIGTPLTSKVVDVVSLVSLVAAYVAAHFSSTLTGGSSAPLAQAAAQPPQNGNNP